MVPGIGKAPITDKKVVTSSRLGKPEPLRHAIAGAGTSSRPRSRRPSCQMITRADAQHLGATRVWRLDRAAGAGIIALGATKAHGATSEGEVLKVQRGLCCWWHRTAPRSRGHREHRDHGDGQQSPTWDREERS